MDSDSFLSILGSLDYLTWVRPDVPAVVALVLALLFLLCSALISASENAFFSLSAADLDTVEESKRASDCKIISLKEDSERLLATLLISNNLMNVAFIVLLNFFFAKTVVHGRGDVAFLFGLTLVLVLVLLLFGEIIPKICSSRHPLGVCRMMASPMMAMRKLLWPVSSLFVHSKHLATKVVHTEKHAISVDELEQALELTDKKDIAEEQNMLEGIIRFGGEMAKEIMTPRMDIVDLDMNTAYPEVLRCIVESNYSRIPVYAGSRDNVKGILYIKDLLPHLNKPANFRWQSLIRPPYFVPETKMIDDLLRDFQTNKVHIAVVVDEFGGTSGIVTMEDIIEEIVGEINDEYDEEERQYAKIGDNVYVFEGKVLLTDFFKVLQLDDDVFEAVEGEADTLAGLLLEIKGEFPELHEILRYKNYAFEVLEMDDRRILKVKVSVLPETEAEEGES